MEKEIQDLEQINKIIDTLFSVLPVYLLVNGKSQIVKIITNTSQGLVIKPPAVVPKGDKRVLTITNSGSVYIFIFKKLGSQAGYELLKPVQASTKKAHRETERFDLSAGNFRVFATNIVKQGEIGKYLSGDSAKVSSITKNALAKIKHKFSDVKIYVQERQDHIMRLLSNYDKAIFIPDADKPELVTEDYVPYNEYVKLKSTYKNTEKYRSEIAFPIKYRNYTLIGYIHVLHKEPLELDAFNLIKLSSSNIKRELQNTGIVQFSKEICNISDISESGLSFIHPPSILNNKLFITSEAILLDLVFSEEHKVTVRAIVRNITAQEKDFRIGCQFYPQNELEMQAVREFLISKTKQDLEAKDSHITTH
ncbi:MAG: PilZ domain-containing protein [Spirochaetota bacterium]